MSDDNQRPEKVLAGIEPEDIEIDLNDLEGQTDGMRLRGMETSAILRILVEVCGRAIRNDKDRGHHQDLFDELAAMATAMAEANRRGDQ